jgi:hypothetical protein
MARFHLRDLVHQLGERDLVLVDEHPRGGQDPAAIIGDAQIDR